MSYARWANKEEILEHTTRLTWQSDIKKSGITVMYDEDSIYVDDSEMHNLVIGGTGSGKTQTTILPQLYLSIRAGESFIINDVRGEIFNKISGLAKENGYDVQVLNFVDMSKGNNYNPLYLPYKLYKEENVDAAVELIENVAYNIVSDSTPTNADPFWEQSAINLFTGLTLYAFDNINDKAININTIANLANNIDGLKNEFEKIEKNSLTISYLTPIINAPKETRGSIISVLLQKVLFITSRESISKLLCNNNLDLENVKVKKTAIFVIGDGRYSSIVLPMIINQAYNIIKIKNDVPKRLNIVIDEFETIKKMNNFVDMLTYGRSLNIKFTAVIKSILHLENNYGPKEAEFIKMAFNNIIYLLSNDVKTLEIISRDCGRQDETTPLISLEELKVLKPFEAIILMNRMYPIKTKLLPYFELKIEDKEPVLLNNLEYNDV